MHSAIVSLNDIRFEQARRPTLTNVELATVAAAFNVVLWITLVSFPFIQVCACVCVYVGTEFAGNGGTYV